MGEFTPPTFLACIAAAQQATVMLYRELEDGGALAIPQPAHAWLSGQMLRHWGAPGFARPEPFEPVVLAAEQHDIAWLPWEAAPSFDAATGRPTVFHAVGARSHAPMWAQGVALARAAWGLWPALLISRHGSLIYRRYMDRHRVAPEDVAAADAYLAEQGAAQAAMQAALGASDAQVAANGALLRVTDALSLAICWGPGREGFAPAGEAPVLAGPDLALRLGGTDTEHLTLDPWPFAVPVLEVACEALHLAAPARFADAAAMRAGLATAPRVMLRAVLRPAG